VDKEGVPKVRFNNPDWDAVERALRLIGADVELGSEFFAQ